MTSGQRVQAPDAAATASPAGHVMRAEMDEQPAVLDRLAEQLDTLSGQVRQVVRDRPAGVAFLARGSSDNAALLGRYAVEFYSGLPTCLVAPSLLTAYGREPNGFAGWLVVALSQSGQTPEIVELAGRFAAAGAVVVAITNDRTSALASAATLTIDLAAGAETAVPATKTVTGQMLATIAVATGLGVRHPAAEQVRGISGAVATVLRDRAPVDRLAATLARFDRMVVVGRGMCYPAALETALKLQETSALLAHGFSTADFRHGPIAVCGPDTPAILLAGSGPADADTTDLRRLLTDRRAPVVLAGTAPEADLSWPPTAGPAECLLATIRGQQLAHAIALARGIDPDQPPNLSKITLTH